MRIAIFNIDSLASNSAIRLFISQYGHMIKLLGLSPPFRRSRGGVLAQSWKHTRASGATFSNFLGCNFLLPRKASFFAPRSATLEGLCQSRGINVIRLDDANSEDVQRNLQDAGIDLIVSCYFDQILCSELIALPQHGVINIHSSLLPQHRGPMPVLYSSLDAPPSFGVSIHAVDAGIDTGPVLAQESYVPASNRSILGIMSDLHEQGVGLLDNVLADIEACRALPVSVQTEGSYESFPGRSEIARSRQLGFALFDRHDANRALHTPMSI
jgi:methionyl-tRNA formyltransferase